MRMSNIVAIVGMGEGLGLGIARRFAQEGFTIAMLARNASKLQSLGEILQSEGYTALSFVADAGSAPSLQAALEQVRSQVGAPTVLVYNAVVPRVVNVLQETADSLTNDFKVNVAGALAATQAVLPAMQAQGSGTILFTGGGFALYPSPDFASISIGKAGIRSLAKTLSDALRPQGIRAGTITICGTVDAADAKYNPASIAAAYWTFHSAPDYEAEVMY